MLVNSLNMGKDWDVLDMQGTICRILCCNYITSSYNSLFSVLSWSLSFLVLANFCVIIFNFSLVSSNSFFCSTSEVVVELDVTAADAGGSEECACFELVVVRLVEENVV